MIFLSAQDLITFYLWQTQVCIWRLKELGVRKNSIHVLFAKREGQKILREDMKILRDIAHMAKVYIYEDSRINPGYLSSIRPHVIAKHFKQFQYLSNERIFYHDCDALLTTIPPLISNVIGDGWYVSDTGNYLDSSYIISRIGEESFRKMCKIVDIPPEVVRAQDCNCGGAQYLMAKATEEFWSKVETDSEHIYKFLANEIQQKRSAFSSQEMPHDHPGDIQHWCSDMWAVLWNALYFKHSVKVHEDLAFCWPKQHVSMCSKRYIFHNAGIKKAESDEYFFKADYVFHTPYQDAFDFVRPDSCSHYYISAIRRAAKREKKKALMEMTFLIPVMIDSEERHKNLLTIVRYLQKYFRTNIIILEYGETCQVDISAFDEFCERIYMPGENKLFSRTHLNNILINAAKTKYITLYDVDVIVPTSQIVQAVTAMKIKGIDMVFPYDGCFVNVDTVSGSIFSKILSEEFLAVNKDKYFISSTRSFGGCVMINRDVYIECGGDNELITSWGPDDIERYLRLKILGKSITRVKGVIFHLPHPRTITSSYATAETRIHFMKILIDIFNSNKNGLRERMEHKKD